MAEPVPISLGLRSNPARNSQAGSARLINCLAEETGEEGKSVWTLYGAPGLRNFGTVLNDGPVRFMIVVGETLYVVSGRDVFAVGPGGTASRIGGIPTDGPVYGASNRRVPAEIGLVSGGGYFLIDVGANSLTQISDVDLPAPLSISFLNGYFVFPVANARYMLSGLDDGSTIDGLDEGTAEFLPDDLVRSITLENELILGGTQSLEWHQDLGNEDFPFQRVHATEIGMLAGDSAALVPTPTRKTVIFVANDHTVRLVSGYSTEVISTNEIQQLIKNVHDAGNINQLRGFGFADSGRFAYCLTCDTFSRVWDAKVGWYERKSYGLNRWRVGSVVQFGTKLVAGDYATGQLYELRGDVYDEAGDPLIAEVITPVVHAFPYRLALNGLFIDMARGVGLNSPQDHIANPKLTVAISRDGGDSWGAERERNIGTLAQKAKRIQPIYRMGTCSQAGAQFRLRLSAPVERVIMSMALDSDRLAP